MTHVRDNWLGAEPLIIAQLKAEVAGLQDVYNVADWPNLDKSAEPTAPRTPAAHVIYLGDQVLPAPVNGEAQVVDQLWGVALVVRNARGAAEVRAQAGVLIPKIVAALAGWKCGLDGMREFRRAAVRATPDVRPNGNAVFPLIFAARTFA